MPSQPNVSKAAVTIVLSAGLLGGCMPTKKADDHQTPPPPPIAVHTTTQPTIDDPVIATVGTTKIVRSELEKPLLEAYGFNLLMLIIQRDMARDACREQGIKVLPSDVKWEYEWTVNQMFPNLQPTDDREKLLEQFLAQPKPHDQMSTRTELEIIVDTNAHLRKLVEPTISKAVTDDLLQQQFDEEYGAQVKVRTIVVANPQDAAAIRQKLDAGADFATLARQFSRDPNTKPLGGELPAFTLNSTRLPDNFKRVAFALKPGEVSDPVAAAGGYHLIKLEQRIAPKAVKFEKVKDSLREDYQAKLVVEAVKGVRAKLAQQALAQLAIVQPTLKAEFDKRLAARDQLIRDREKMRDQMEKDRQNAPPPTPLLPAGSKPATAPTTSTAATKPAATAPASAPVTDAPKAVLPPSTPSRTPEMIRPAPVPAPATLPATAPATRAS